VGYLWFSVQDAFCEILNLLPCLCLGHDLYGLKGLMLVWRFYRDYYTHNYLLTYFILCSLFMCAVQKWCNCWRCYQHLTMWKTFCVKLIKREAFEKCWAHSPLRAAALTNFTLPFTRCRYCRTPPAHRCPQRQYNSLLTSEPLTHITELVLSDTWWWIYGIRWANPTNLNPLTH